MSMIWRSRRLRLRCPSLRIGRMLQKKQPGAKVALPPEVVDRKSTRLNSSHANISSFPLHDALPIYLALAPAEIAMSVFAHRPYAAKEAAWCKSSITAGGCRSEEHTSELQSRQYLLFSPTRRSSDLSGARAG